MYVPMQSTAHRTVTVFYDFQHLSTEENNNFIMFVNKIMTEHVFMFSITLVGERPIEPFSPTQPSGLPFFC